MLLMVPAIALLVLVGCTRDTGKKDGKGTTTEVTGDKGGGKEATEITSATTATIKGTVKLSGEKPKIGSIVDTKGFKENSDRALCGMGDTNEQMWMVDNAGMVENVVVFLGPPSSKKFKISDDLKKPFKDEMVEIKQPYCQYIPHIAAVYADVQKFRVINDADTTHNVKLDASVKNGGDGQGGNLPKGKDSATKTWVFSMQTNPIKIGCTAHTWMTAQVLTFDHPYFAVSKKDGSFTIKNVPISEELSVYMWHESKSEKWEAKKATFKEGDNPLELTISAK
jgi:hypothetical protein